MGWLVSEAFPDIDPESIKYDIVAVTQSFPQNGLVIPAEWTLLKKVEASCDRYLIAGGTNVEAELEQGPAI